MTPHEVKFALDTKLAALARGGMVLVIVNLHSLVVEGDTVHVGFDIVPGDEPLFFNFELPATVGRDELSEFSAWLAWAEYGALH
jgi:hypothetical protein